MAIPIVDWLLNPSGLTAHGFCLSWAPGLVALHVVSDAATGLAYFSIPIALAALASRRPDVKYGWMANLFGAFIIFCGATHLMSIFTLWFPAYGIEGLIKLTTAFLSIATAAILWPLMPRIAALPSASQLATLNGQLAATIDEQERTALRLRESEAEVRRANIELERRVRERTAELEAANARLEQAKAELEAVVEQRTAALAERDLLLREVYHRVKNNLQLIDGLLVMQRRELADPAAKAALKGLRDRVYALGLVHQQLMGSKDLQTFDVAPYLNELTANILESGASREVELVVEAAPLVAGLDFAIPLGLLVTELVTNALKHAFPDGRGRIEVRLERLPGGEILVVVADDGVGLPEPSPGAARKVALGGRIIEGLVAQLKGRMTVIGAPGTRIEVRLAGAS